MYYYLLIAFQAFCIFHIYKSRNEYYWYFIVFFVPIIGSVVYFFLQVVNKRNINNAGEKITTILNPNKKINDLEKKAHFSDTFQNKANLADAYMESRNFIGAIKYYQKALNSNFESNPHTVNKLVKCFFELKEHQEVVKYASKLNLDKSFKDTICIYAISLEKCGQIEKAGVEFKKTDIRYSNYPERLELARFLVRHDKKEEANETITGIIFEIDNMIETNKRKYKYIYRETTKLLDGI